MKVLNLGMNNLGDGGIENLTAALSYNGVLEALDLFDVNFGDVGIQYIAGMLKSPMSRLKSLRMANTSISPDQVEVFMQIVTIVPINCFRWFNLGAVRQGKWEKNTVDKII